MTYALVEDKRAVRECQPVTLEVEGSSPFQVANLICWCGSMAEQLTCNQQVVGSTPITSSNIRRISRVAKGGRL